MTLTLHHFPQSRSLRVVWTLKELGIDAEIITRALDRNYLKSADFKALNPLSKVPVFFAYALRTENGFEVFFEKSNDEIYSDLESSVEYMNAKIQKIVDKAPEQYQWTYKRFSIQPDGEPPFY